MEVVGCDLAGEMVRVAKDKRLYSSVAHQVSEFIQHNVLIKRFLSSQLPHKPVNSIYNTG